MHPFPSPWARRRAALRTALWENGTPTQTGRRTALIALAWSSLAFLAWAVGTSPLPLIVGGSATVAFFLADAHATGKTILRRRANARLSALFDAAVDVYAPFLTPRPGTAFLLFPQHDGRLLVQTEYHRWFAPPEERHLPPTPEEEADFSHPVHPWLQNAAARIVAEEGLDAETFGHRSFRAAPTIQHPSRHAQLAAIARLQAVLPTGIDAPALAAPA